MATTRDILFGVALPAVVAMVVVLIARLTTRSRPAWATPVALGAGFFAGAWGLLRPTFPPHDSLHWLVFAAPVLALAGLLDNWLAARKSQRAITYIARFVIVASLATTLVWLIARPLFESSWEETPQRGVMWIGAIALSISIWWILMDAQVARSPGPAISIGILICIGLASASMAMSGSQTFGLLGGILAAIVAVIAVSQWLLPQLTLARGGMLVAGILWGAVLAASLNEFFSELRPLHAALLFASPIFGLIADIPAFRNLRPWARGFLRIALMITSAIVATILAWIAFSRAMAESGELGVGLTILAAFWRIFRVFLDNGTLDR